MSYRRPDHWTRKAKTEGYAARSVFKLAQIDRQFPVVPKTGRALDLGCFPGSWSRWLLLRGLAVTGVDLEAPEFTGGTWIVGSALEIDAEALGGPFDLVVSDMAPNTTGDRFTDHCRQMALATRALDLCEPILRPGGGFVTKVFDGEDAPALVKRVQASFAESKRIKPEATRGRSVEFFVAARGYRPPPRNR